MSIRSSLALNVAPLGLRVALGLTFIWAGIGKIAHSTAITDPRDQAILADWGQIDATPEALTPPQDEDPQIDPGQGDSEQSDPIETDPGLSDPETDPAADTDDTEQTQEPPADDAAPSEDAGDDQPPAVEDDPVVEDDGSTEEDETAGEDTPEPDEDPGILPVSYVQSADEVEVKRVLGLALMIHHAANPGVDDEGRAKMPLWPQALAKGSLPVVIAWIAAILELVCGAALLTGFFTRMATLPIIGTMLTAMWLTQIGPALQAGGAYLGFLPNGVFEIGPGGYAYTQLLWQFALACSGVALLLIGPGCFSIDRLIFGAPSMVREEEARQVEFVPMGD
ncbi:MAG: DoxX family membrane protein [Phycisphaera sp.]|nr:MAG: DoxX family membrane protein [Phycisphaera sp.]